MTPLVPIMLFSWVPLTVFLFFVLKPHQAVLVSVIGGWLLLPTTGYHIPGIPFYSKGTAIALGLIVGGRISGKRRAASFHRQVYDLPMLFWCFFCPLASSLSNQLGFYDGLAGAWESTINWGIPYLAGRIYFDNSDKLRDLCIGLIIGGLIYLPLCLYEIRMSPQLNNMIYGFFPHSFMQHMRYGGYRPIIFMQHGLMVALWMAVTTTVAFWFWRSREIKYIKNIPLSFWILALVATTILCKSANGWFSLALGCGAYFVFRSFKSFLPFRLLLLMVPLYILLRITGAVSGEVIESKVGLFLDEDRTSSLQIRTVQEDLFVAKTLERPFLGWGWIGRGWPTNKEIGGDAIGMVDALWVVTFNTRGVFGILSLVTMMLIGPWLVLQSRKKQEFDTTFFQMGPVLLSLVVILFMIDSLFNGMLNPVYILGSGALLGFHVHHITSLSKTETRNGVIRVNNSAATSP